MWRSSRLEVSNSMDQDRDATEVEYWASIGAETIRNRDQIRSEETLYKTNQSSDDIDYSDDTDEEDWTIIGPEALRKRGQTRVEASRVDNPKTSKTQNQSEQDLGDHQDKRREDSSRSRLLRSSASRVLENMLAASRARPSSASRTIAPTASTSMDQLKPTTSQSPVSVDSDSDSDLSPVDESFIDKYESESRATALLSKRKSAAETSTARPAKILKTKNGSTETDVVDDDESELSSIASEEDHPVVKARKPRKPRSPKPQPKPSTSRSGRNAPDLNEYYETNQSGYLKFTKKNHWSNPGTQKYDVKRMLESDQCVAPDNLLNRPSPGFKYILNDGKLRAAPHYEWLVKARENKKKISTGHPKYAEHVKNGTQTRELELYYNLMPKDRILPLAGMIDVKDTKDSEVRNLELALGNLGESDLTNLKSQEEAFNARPSIHLPVPDHIKAILVDDWENVTKNQQLVPLPAPHSVESILNDYLAFENPKRQAGTHQADLLIEVVQGLKEYFEKCLGRILLYRFERQQYLEVREGWNKADGDLAGKTAVSTYGAEHFCRLIVSLPELLAQTNMDQQSCNRLCEELTKLTIWLGRNALKYFSSEYETPGPAYIEKARNG